MKAVLRTHATIFLHPPLDPLKSGPFVGVSTVVFRINPGKTHESLPYTSGRKVGKVGKRGKTTCLQVEDNHLFGEDSEIAEGATEKMITGARAKVKVEMFGPVFFLGKICVCFYIDACM